MMDFKFLDEKNASLLWLKKFIVPFEWNEFNLKNFLGDYFEHIEKLSQVSRKTLIDTLLKIEFHVIDQLRTQLGSHFLTSYKQGDLSLKSKYKKNLLSDDIFILTMYISDTSSVEDFHLENIFNIDSSANKNIKEPILNNQFLVNRIDNIAETLNDIKVESLSINENLSKNDASIQFLLKENKYLKNGLDMLNFKIDSIESSLKEILVILPKNNSSTINYATSLSPGSLSVEPNVKNNFQHEKTTLKRVNEFQNNNYPKKRLDYSDTSHDLLNDSNNDIADEIVQDHNIDNSGKAEENNYEYDNYQSDNSVGESSIYGTITEKHIEYQKTINKFDNVISNSKHDEMIITRTQRGGKKLVYNGFSYTVDLYNQESNIYYWKCSRTGTKKIPRCHGRAKTIGTTEPVYTTCTHNHDPEYNS